MAAATQSKRTIRETQYVELTRYEHGNYMWVNGGTINSLVAAGMIEPATHDRTMFRITLVGTTALAAFRARYGIRS